MLETTGKVQVAAERIIPAPAPQLYTFIADYLQHHPNFLPPAFSNLTVERGGVGGGTVFSVDLKVAGRTTRMRTAVDEPDPGRVLKEIGLDSDSVTTFEVTAEDRDVSRVHIHTEWTPTPGIAGWVEKRLAPRLLRQLYADELARLERYASTRTVLAPSAREMSSVSG